MASQVRILSAGIGRSGSTILFNIVRLLAQSRSERVYSCWIDHYNHAVAAEAEYVIVKAHAPDAQLAAGFDYILTSHRDPRDIARSVLKVGFVDTQEAAMIYTRDTLIAHLFWAPRSSYDLAYEAYMADPAAEVAKLATVIAMPVGPEEARRIASEVQSYEAPELPPGRYDPKTLLNPRHREGGGLIGAWGDTLVPAAVAKMEEAFGEWMAAYGYRPSMPPAGTGQS